MAEEPKSMPVTRAEMYPIFSMVYLLLAFLFLGRIQQIENDLLQVIAHCLFFIVAIGSSFAFSYFAWRERRRRKSEQ